MSIESVDYVPVYVWNKGVGVKNRYELLNINEAMLEYESGDTSKIRQSLYNTLKSELADIKKVLGEPITKKEKEEANTGENGNTIIDN